LVTAIHGHGVHGDVPCRGSGSVPLWLADQFPKSQVDVVELEVRAERRGEKIGVTVVVSPLNVWWFINHERAN
jgi:hypothetical protein